MKIQKAGCILINMVNEKIGLIYRDRHNDFSFPKGHLEKGETLIECAIRETEEETKRKVKLYSDEIVAEDHYVDSNGDESDVYYYLGIDDGVSDNDSTDTHTLVWKDFDDVKNILTYRNLRNTWLSVKDKVYEIMYPND
jgi:ADP-ribose pyrophosphatase YjhB (NUDIX family)